MGPRSCERGKRNRPYQAFIMDKLQWGRVRVNAESSDHSPGWQAPAWLQWGRVRVNAERGCETEVRRDQLALQWGRVRVNAERWN